MPPALYCPRCDDMVGVVRHWNGWKPAWVAWRLGLIVGLALSPILASDFCVMLPSFMAYLAAGGPIYAHAKQKPVCSRCSLELDGDARGGTLVRNEN